MVRQYSNETDEMVGAVAQTGGVPVRCVAFSPKGDRLVVGSEYVNCFRPRSGHLKLTRSVQRPQCEDCERTRHRPVLHSVRPYKRTKSSNLASSWRAIGADNSSEYTSRAVADIVLSRHRRHPVKMALSLYGTLCRTRQLSSKKSTAYYPHVQNLSRSFSAQSSSYVLRSSFTERKSSHIVQLLYGTQLEATS